MKIIRHVCGLAGSFSLLDDIRADAIRTGLTSAIQEHATPQIFDWAMGHFSYQGISDQVARNYIAANGNATWQSIETGLTDAASCPKLQSYWEFSDCRYDKGSFSCAEPDHIEQCPLPQHHLRNGRLNATAFSFFLFVRDVAGGDIVEWINTRLRSSGGPSDAEALIGPLRAVYGLSDKVLSMTLSTLLMAAPQTMPLWVTSACDLIAVDTLAHNFLHRAGILADCGAAHPYGDGCYRPGGCADIIHAVSAEIDARKFNERFPSNFPRFVQHAIWRWCAADGFNICNGREIDDSQACRLAYCQLFKICRKMPLKT